MGRRCPARDVRRRDSAAQNWEERTGIAFGNKRLGTFRAVSTKPAAVSPYGGGGLRYLSFIKLPGGAGRCYLETT